MKTKKLLSLLLLGLLCSIGNVWGADPTLIVDFGTTSSEADAAKAFSKVIKTYSTEGITLTFYDNSDDAGTVQTAFAGNLSGHYYATVAKSSTAYNHGSFVISADTKIDSVAIFWVPNTKNKDTNFGVVGWSPSTSLGTTVDTLFTTPKVKITSDKSYSLVRWDTINLSNSNIAALALSRKFPKNYFSYKESLYSSNFGEGQTCCIFGVKVWLHPATPAETYTVTINPNGGLYASTPDGWSLTDGKYTKSGLSGSFDVPDGLTKEGYDLNGWKDGQGTDISTLPITLSKDTTLVAQWVAHATSSDATLSALSVAGCTLNKTFDPATTAYTIDLPFYASMPAVSDVTATKNDSYAADPEISISGNVITIACEAEDGTTTKTYTITVTIANVPTASSSINIEQLVLDYGKSYDIGAALTTAHIAYVDKDALDSLIMGTADKNKTDCNEAYLGLKFKLTTSKVTIIVPSNQSLNVKFGAITDGSNLTVSVNGSTAATPSLTNNVYALAASEGAKEVVFALGGAKTVVFKQIMINEDIATVRPFAVNLAATTNGTISTLLPKYAKGDEVTVVCEPSSGYQLGSLSVSGYDNAGAATSVAVSSSKFTMPGSPVNITATFIPVSVSGTISDCGWNTFSSPYPLDLTQVVTNGTVYYASESDGSTVTLEGAPSQVVPAGEGLMVKGTAGETFTIKTSSDAGTAISGNLLKGQTVTGNVSATNHYVFGYVTETPSTYGFYALTATTEVQAGKAYLEYPAAMAPSFLRIVEGEQSATGVENIEANDKAVKFIENGQLYILRDGVVYDTVGRVIR